MAKKKKTVSVDDIVESLCSNVEPPELKPCPFCGEKDVFIRNPKLIDTFSIVSNPKMEVVCPGCGIGFDCGLYMGCSREDLTDEDIEKINKYVAEKWNRRE